MSASQGDGVVHLIAELSGITPALLHDAPLLGGLLIAAAGAAGLRASSPPLLRCHALRGVDALLLFDGGHVTLHAEAHRRTLLLDVLAPEPVELSRALDVFTRRLAPLAINAERLIRLAASV